MNMRFAKWATAVMAASTFGIVGCDSGGDESGSTSTTTDTVSGDATGGTDQADTSTTDDTTVGPGADATDEADTTAGTDDTTAVEDATPEGDTTEADTTVDPVDPCTTGSKCFDTKCCTCSGAECGSGIDNSLAGIASLANSQLQGTIDDGTVNIVAEFVGDTAAEFTINMYTGKPFPKESTCDVTKDVCDWEIGLAAFTADCQPLISFKNAKIDGDKLTAGGKDGLFQIAIPIQGFVLELKVIGARIEGTVTRDGDKITGMAGILAGAVPKKALEEAVDKLPDSGLPIPKSAIKSLLGNVVKADIDGLDADGNIGTDGTKESASLSIKFTGVGAKIASIEAYVAPDPVDPAAPASCTTPPALETFSAVSFRMNSLALGAKGTPGEALDVDGVCVDPIAPAICE